MKNFMKNLETTTFMMMFIIAANLWIQKLDMEVFDSSLPIAAYWIGCTIAGAIGRMIHNDFSTWIKEGIEFIENRTNRFDHIKKTETGLLKKEKS